MNFLEFLSDFSISQEEYYDGLQLLDLNQKDIQSITAPTNRFSDLLKKFNIYTQVSNPNGIIQGCYRSASAHELVHLREAYHLESIAGTGVEIDQLCNLMHWVHGLAIHTSNPAVPKGLDSLQLLNLIENNGVRINCGMFAAILHDVYTSLGWKSRIIYLKPHQPNFLESHVVNAVYSNQLRKWLYFDPNLNAFFMNERGEILSIPEIRQRLIAREEDLFVANSLAFNSENRVFAALGKHFGIDFYKFYISKNIFRYSCPHFRIRNQKSGQTSRVSIELIPLSSGVELAHQENLNIMSSQVIYTANIGDFWQPPRID